MLGIPLPPAMQGRVREETRRHVGLRPCAQLVAADELSSRRAIHHPRRSRLPHMSSAPAPPVLRQQEDPRLLPNSRQRQGRPTQRVY
jgi:hypothetical protein